MSSSSFSFKPSADHPGRWWQPSAMVMAGARDKDGNPPTGHSILWGPESAARSARLDALFPPPARQQQPESRKSTCSDAASSSASLTGPQQPKLRLRGGRAEPPLLSTVYAEYIKMRKDFGREDRIPVHRAFDFLEEDLNELINTYVNTFGEETFATVPAFRPLRDYQEKLRVSRTTGARWMSAESFGEMAEGLEWKELEVEEAIGAWDQ
ncbi:MAG: hypothetical protein Q9228_001673 [Teloschistes exilis]